MRSKPFIIIATALSGLLIALGGLYAYDSSRGDTIAKGVSVGGINIGGMDADAAQRKLEQRFLGALRRPIVIHHDRISWVLRPQDARVASNVAAMVDEAVDRSKDGGIFGRSWRNLTGGSLDVALKPNVTYYDPAIVRLLDKVRLRVDRAPTNAELKFVKGEFVRERMKVGLKVDASRLHKQIRAAIVSPTAPRSFVAKTTHVQPKITDQLLAKENSTVLLVDRKDFRLKLFKDLKLKTTYTVAVGQAGLETPAGLYHIQNKAIDPAWHVPNSAWAGKLAGKVIPGGTPENPLKSRWMGIWDGAGIHGVDPSEYSSLGHAASHGCVRMRIDDVEALYDKVDVGTPIYIE